MIRVIEQSKNQWMVWNSKNQEAAIIHKFDDYMMGRRKVRYRVDVNGKTVATLLDTRSEALKIARSKVKLKVAGRS